MMRGGMMKEENLDRRRFLKLSALMGTAALSAGLLGGCGSSRSEASSASAGGASASADSAAASASAASAASASEEAAASASATSASAASSATASGTASASAQAAQAESAIVAVFSWSGNTLQVAERVAADVGCELFRIEPATPYTTDYNEMLQVCQDEQAAGTLPALAATVPNWSSYGTVYLGFPTWWSHLPQIVKSFLAEHDCAGKVIYPFNTHGGSGFASTLSDLAAACPGADIREGLSIPGESVASSTERIDAWVQASA